MIYKKILMKFENQEPIVDITKINGDVVIEDRLKFKCDIGLWVNKTEESAIIVVSADNAEPIGILELKREKECKDTLDKTLTSLIEGLGNSNRVIDTIYVN